MSDNRFNSPPNQPTWSQAYRVTRDGVEKMVGTHNECFAYILRSQSQSVDWACRHEGWKIELIARLP